MKTLTTLIIALLINNLFSQNKNAPYYVRQSEIRINQNGFNGFDPYLYTQIYSKINGHLGFWNFSYIRDHYPKPYQKTVAGPCFMKKNLVIGIGYGRDSKHLNVLGAVFALNHRRLDFSFYGESIKTEYRVDYWDVTELNFDLDRTGKFKIGFYSQARIGTGMQLTTKINQNISLNIGTGYTENRYASKRYSFIPKFVLNIKI